MINQFQKVHATSNRVRYKYSLLKDKYLDENILKKELEKLSGVISVRVNKKAHSVIFNFEDSFIYKEVEDKLSSLTIDKLLSTCDETASVCVSCVNNEEPSFKKTALASFALVSERFVTSDLLKFSITAGASYPIIIDGIKELLKKV